MSYATFLLLFLVLPIVVLAALAARRNSDGAKRAIAALVLVQTAALLYTTPWDNYLIYRGVWMYGSNRVIGTIGYVPVEEYVFFILQPLLTGLWYLVLRGGLRARAPEGDRGLRVWGTSGWVLVALAGALALVSPNQRLLYLGLITAWCGPVLAGMTWLGYRHVWVDRRVVALGIAAPTLYLWVADRFAIGDGIWDIAGPYSVGFEPFGLPVEEALFFLVTNAMVVQGLVMLLPERSPREPASTNRRGAAVQPPAHAP
jgi:lycopene cyclase domain-containing protein